MELELLRPVYRGSGPYATVYLEGRSPGADSGEQLRLRWRELCDRLASSGADAASVDALDSLLSEDDAAEVQTNGRVLVVSGPDVVLDERWDAAPGAGDVAHWGSLPELGRYVRERLRAVRLLVVIADQQGAQVRQVAVAERHEPREADADIVEGGAERGVHKPRGGALSHNQIQRRADESLGRNAADVVDHVRRAAATFRPRVLVLAGDVQARTAIRDVLPGELDTLVVETDRGGRDENASDEALTDELLRIAGEESQNRAENYTERLQAGLPHGQAVQGYQHVIDAAEHGAVETLLLEDGADVPNEPFVLKACTDIKSSVGLLAEGSAVLDGVAALRRFTIDDDQSPSR